MARDITHIWTRNQIEASLDLPFCLQKIAEGFIAYSNGQAIVPPIGHLEFKEPPGEMHIKYGYLQEQPYYVIKIASGFYQNPAMGLPSSNGLFLVFHKQTGELAAILLDEGLLTDIRTALTGALCAKYLAPPIVHMIGIIGTGTQALQQLQALRLVTPCRQVKVWGRNYEKAIRFTQDPRLIDYQINPVATIEEITQTCQLIVTTTPSREPLLFAHHLQPGTHVTAVGADSPGKQELDESALLKADLLVVDNLVQCQQYGDLAHIKCPASLKRVIELGKGLQDPCLLARSQEDITIADLTGVAVQDIQIAQAVLNNLNRLSNQGFNGSYTHFE